MLRTWAVVALAALAAGGQQQPPFKTGTELVRVDVTVLDRDGRPVPNLVQDDFVVMEDRVPQRIQAFREVALNGNAHPDDDLTLTIGSRETTRLHELARDEVRLFLVFWDEFHIPPDPHGRQIREELARFIRTGFGETDFVAIMDPWTPSSDITFSRDRYRLANDVSARRGRRGVYLPLRNDAEENHMRLREGPEFARALVAVSALKAAALHLATLRESRKTVLYVGHEFGVGRDTHAAAQDVIEAANASNVAIYSINPEGLRMSGPSLRTGLLASIAHNTGGESFLSNSPARAMTRVVSQSTVSYLIGYAPSPLRQDGKFHEIEVKVKGGFQVRARNGYWAPDAASKARARAAAAAAVLPPHVESAFAELARLRPDSDQRPYEPRTILVPDAAGAALIVRAPVLWRVQRPVDLKMALAGELPPHAGRAFTRAERILGSIELAGPHATAATLTIGLIDRRGKRLTDLPFTRRGAAARLDLPLQAIARGDYLIAIEAEHAGTRAAAYVPVRIAGQ
jgi:VWFA-related protein